MIKITLKVDTSGVTNMNNMFDRCNNLKTLDMRNAEFNASSYSWMFTGMSNLSVIVKDEDARSFIQEQLGSRGTAVVV